MNSYRRIILIFLFLCSVCITAFADNTSDTNYFEEEELIYFKSLNDKEINDSSKCWQCRDVNDGFATQIIGFDFVTGVTKCKLYDINNLSESVKYDKFDPSQKNNACSVDTSNFKSKYEEIVSSTRTVPEAKSSIEYKQSDSQLTMSQFLTSLVTLNPNIIDRDEMYNTGELVFKDGKEMYNISSITKTTTSEKFEDFWNSVKKMYGEYISGNSVSLNMIQIDDSKYVDVSVLDGFNKNNMAYFSNLFKNMKEVYQHLQVFLFVLVGGFFVAQIGTSKLQTYLENRGESSGKQSYLHKFYIPLFMVGMFYMPIPEGTNKEDNASIMQNIIRYFATYSTNIADMANALGAKTYMDKIYTSVGGYSDQGIVSIIAQYYQNKQIMEKSNEIYNTTCRQRYGDLLYSVETVNNLNRENNVHLLGQFDQKITIIGPSAMDINQVAGTKNDISFPTCVWLPMVYDKAKNNYELAQQKREAMGNYEGKIAEKLNAIDEYFATRNQQLGWIDAILLPSSGMLVELFTLEDDTVESYNTKKSVKSNTQAIQRAQKQGDIKATEDEINNSITAWLSSKLVWMMLPGASSIKDFIQSNATTFGELIGGIAGAATATPAIPIPIIGALLGSIVGSTVGSIIGSLGGTLLGYTLTVYIMQETIEKIPLLVCTTASLIAFMSYLVSLCKYFYISPFIVAFSMAQKRMDKIIDFLLSGISIFLKPVLIVLFIYLALFVHTLIDELFLFLATEQFSGIKTSFYNIHTNITIGAITGLLTIFGKLAASYIMWKLIVSGPGWALGLAGIDGKHDDMIASGLEQNLARRAFIA